MFRKALLTLDRSPFSEAALARVPDVTQDEAVVLEVIDSVAEILGRTGPAFEVPAEVAGRLMDAERSDVQEHLDRAAERLRDAGIEKVSTLVREGRPGPAILEVAREQDCDVIVMSTHGYVVHHAEGVAVLLVRPDDEQ
jgi:nucleotide-binding universal stress UspA family protein